MVMIIVKGKNFKPFRSPINGEVITSERQMKNHMAEHNVVHQGEYGDNNGKSYFDRKQKERKEAPFSKEARKDRLNDLIKSVYGYKDREKI